MKMQSTILLKETQSF